MGVTCSSGSPTLPPPSPDSLSGSSSQTRAFRSSSRARSIPESAATKDVAASSTAAASAVEETGQDDQKNVDVCDLDGSSVGTLTEDAGSLKSQRQGSCEDGESGRVQAGLDVSNPQLQESAGSLASEGEDRSRGLDSKGDVGITDVPSLPVLVLEGEREILAEPLHPSAMDPLVLLQEGTEGVTQVADVGVEEEGVHKQRVAEDVDENGATEFEVCTSVHGGTPAVDADTDRNWSSGTISGIAQEKFENESGCRQERRMLLKEYAAEKADEDTTPWDLRKFKENFRVDMIRLDDSEMEFDMVNIDASLANAFRRILISEVPTMAIDEVCIFSNTSIIADEILAHRCGLLPIKADPRLFEYYNVGEDKTSEDSIEFHLKIKCTTNPNAGDSQVQSEKFINHKVYTKHLKWVPIGNQDSMYKPGDLRPVEDDILLAVLRPGQEIDLVAYCHKGIGKDHAKFSPVCTAHYRLMPSITLTKPVTGDAAFRLQKLFSSGVIEVRDVDGEPTAVVAHPRRDRGSRNVLSAPEFKDCVELGRVADHFIFSIESAGSLMPDVLMLEAVKVMIQKCEKYLRELENFKE